MAATHCWTLHYSAAEAASDVDEAGWQRWTRLWQQLYWIDGAWILSQLECRGDHPAIQLHHRRYLLAIVEAYEQ